MLLSGTWVFSAHFHKSFDNKSSASSKIHSHHCVCLLILPPDCKKEIIKYLFAHGPPCLAQ